MQEKFIEIEWSDATSPMGPLLVKEGTTEEVLLFYLELL
jgi:hypothetical protein